MALWCSGFIADLSPEAIGSIIAIVLVFVLAFVAYVTISVVGSVYLLWKNR